MFKWIRARVRDAFLAGIQDGVDALSLPAAPAADGQLDPTEPRLLRLPAADDAVLTEAVPASKRKKLS